MLNKHFIQKREIKKAADEFRLKHNGTLVPVDVESVVDCKL